MNLKQYENGLRGLVNDLSEDLTDKIIVPPASRLLGNIKNRIQRDGKNSAGADIGNYSETPIYVPKSDFKKTGAFKSVGKGGYKGEKVVTTGKGKQKQYKIVKQTPKTMYLPHGYKELRDIQGMPTDIVNFTYRGDLLLDYKMVQETRKILLGIASQKQANKKKKLEERFGTVFPATSEELKEYKNEVTQRKTSIIKKKLTGF